MESNILDATTLEPWVKHSTIFNRYDSLNSGENFELHNDHDPRPLYYQLSAQHGESLTWEYLEQGPERWRVKIGKK